MKIAFALLLLAAPVLAEEGANFDTHKQEAMDMIDKRIAALNQLKSCVQGASSKEALRTCHETHKEERVEFRKEHMDKRIQKMQEKRSKMDQKK